MENKEKFILPVNETPTDQQVLGLLNSAAETMIRMTLERRC